MAETKQPPGLAPTILYRSSKPTSPVRAVEFAATPEGNLSFYYLGWKQDKAAVREWLESPTMSGHVVAETTVNGKSVLVVHDAMQPSETIASVQAKYGHFVLDKKPAKLDPWVMRGVLSTVGQLMQLSSGILQKGAPDAATIGFAVTNLAANGINIIYGAQESEDKHRQRFLKEKLNGAMTPHLKPDEALPDVNDKRAAAREEKHGVVGGAGNAVHNFLKSSSVWFGEIGLRYLGSLILIFPLAKWKGGFKELGRGSLDGAWSAAKNPDAFTRNAGIGWLMGKNIAFFSKAPDPYNPKEHTAIDTFRERFTFPIASVIEAMGAGTMAYDRLANRKISFNKPYLPASVRHITSRDWIGGIGGIIFTIAFAFRIFAPYGTKEINLKEMEAHATDALAKIDPSQMPQMMATSAATLTEHLGKRPGHFGQIYAQMQHDLKQYHGIDINRIPPAPAVPPVNEAEPKTTIQADSAQHHAEALQPALQAAR